MDNDKMFEKLSPEIARKIDNGGTRPKKKTTAKKKAVKGTKKKK